MNVRVVVTETEYKKAESVFSSVEGIECIPTPSEEEALARNITLTGAKHAIVGTEKYTGSLYEALPPGGVIARFGVGHDGIDKAKVKKAHLYCTNTPGVLDHSVAELTIAFILESARKIVNIVSATKNGKWFPLMGSELNNKTLAVIGCGSIGKRVAQIAAFGFQMKVIGCDIREMEVDFLKTVYGFQKIVKEFKEAVADADFVTLHIPGNQSTKHFINGDTLKMIPSKAWLINTARGIVVDEMALFHALKSGTIAGAALDVFEKEPYQPVDSACDLRTLDNVLMSPHISSTTNEASLRMAKRCLQNIKFAEAHEYEKMDIVT